VYVNYSHGDESQEAKYGSLENRKMLAKYKKKWDPNGVFNFYNPVDPEADSK
jgi:FAD/FMN-containing dehydrogenase